MFRLRYLIFLISITVVGQEFTKKDSLRGALLPDRLWFDVDYYHLNLDVDPTAKLISGYNDVYFTVLSKSQIMQLDLFEHMIIDSIIYRNETCTYFREYDTFFIKFPETFKVGTQHQVRVYYHGSPIEALNPPWDGGFVWKEDTAGLPWVGVACQGMGASSWWPCKDHLSDKPDSVRVTCSVPKELWFVGNGNLESDFEEAEKRISTWKVSYPINTYNVSLNIANYSHLQDEYVSNLDTLSLDYYVLKGNEKLAQKQFEQVKPMLAVYEVLFGPYPFWDDGYALVETPYLGMEHQSAIAYGNKFMPGYLGRYPGDMDFDFIVIHESGHEYWGNSVSMNDIADMWIHESFCTYSEALYVEKIYGYEKMLAYLVYQRDFIDGGSPILGHRDVNSEGNSIDMYYKGSWMLHSIRNTISNDSLWFSILKGLAQNFEKGSCDGVDVIDYICNKSKKDLRPIFNQYLSYSVLPVLKYKFKKQKGVMRFYYKWDAASELFDMPIHIRLYSEKNVRLLPSAKYQFIEIENATQTDVEFLDSLFLYEKKRD
ncbi:MAG: M1 family metallopeptidase [Flavobacteriales bacterium]|nr:M1 family metallopeptidase [Flavobacteriales bacterium]